MENSNIKMYHGGKRWSFIPTEIQPSKKNRYEAGVGIYFTNHYQTARKYAGGGRVVHLVEIDKNFRDIAKIKVPIRDMLDFVKSVPQMKRKKEIMMDIVRNAQRTNSSDVSLDVLNNLLVNHEAGAGQVGVEVAKYFVSKGGDATTQKQSGDEVWLVVFNPKIIKKISVVNASSENIEWVLKMG